MLMQWDNSTSAGPREAEAETETEAEAVIQLIHSFLADTYNHPLYLSLFGTMAFFNLSLGGNCGIQYVI